MNNKLIRLCNYRHGSIYICKSSILYAIRKRKIRNETFFQKFSQIILHTHILASMKSSIFIKKMFWIAVVYIQTYSNKY